MAATILIVDDEKDIRTSLAGILEDEGYNVILAADGDDALETVEAELPDLVLLDIWMPGKDGLETLGLIKEQYPSLTVVMISGHGTIETAVKATKLGAYDFIEKPLSLEKVLITVANALRLKTLSLENRELKKTVCKQYELIGDSPQIVALREQMKRIASSESHLLITGEHGTGKGLIAGALHYNSARKDNPFVSLNCAAMPEQLLEEELFGYEKGWQAGTNAQKKGALERGDGGTLFMNELCDLSLESQGRLLRALQDGSFERLGGSRCVKTSVRIIASTSRDLDLEISEGRFLKGLYYHLAVALLTLPPLRERMEDIPALVQNFACRFSKLEGCQNKTLEPAALALLQEYYWPGNVRELKNFVERILIMTPGNIVCKDDIPELVSHNSAAAQDTPVRSFRGAREEFEREFILKKLEENDWNVSRTAELIDVERSNLHRKIKNYGIDSKK